MSQPTSSHSLFAHSKTVIYIETYHNIEVNRYIQENYRQIVGDFSNSHIDFLYLPRLFQDPAYRQIFERNHPFLSDKLDNTAIADIYKAIGRKYYLILDETNTVSFGNEPSVACSYPFEPLDGSALILLDAFADKLENAWQIDVGKSISEQFAAILGKLQEKYNALFQTGHTQYQRVEPPKPKRKWFGWVKETEEDEILGAEILEKIYVLQERGSLKLIGKIIEELHNVNRPVSSLYISYDYRIFLKDYAMKEVMMPPLSKCLYILYLRHPEGIRFKKLYKYYNELLSIYRNVTVHDDMDAAIDSIKAMIDPLNNSVNEKSSRIRAAFLELMPDDLARNYYITGPRGERKIVTLDRSLVEYGKGAKI